MNSNRKLLQVSKSRPTLEGAGVHLKRAFGFGNSDLYDPFLLMDDFRGDSPDRYSKGFPWHPHRGIETITYVLRGKVAHGDSLGNKGVIGPGDVQWMSAGSGIIHQEMPKGDDAGRMGGFQLWANLPASQKMMEPRYRDVTSGQIPEITLAGGVRVRVICGEVNGVQGPVRDVVIDPEYLDVTVPARSAFTRPTRPGHTVLAYAIEGRGCFCHEQDPFRYEAEGENYFDFKRDSSVANHDLVLFGDGEQISVSTEADPLRFLLVSGKPIGEPVAWYGPIVMNTKEELRVAFEEYQNGTFIRHGRPGEGKQ